MTAEEIINLIEEQYMSCPNIVGSEGRLFCYTWWRHDECELLRELLYKITNDFKYTLPDVKREISEAVEQMIKDPKSNEILKRLGSDYDKNGKPYWEN